MRVDNNNIQNLKNGETAESGRSRRTSRADKSGDSNRVGSTAEVDGSSPEISARAKEFASAKRVANDAPDVREARIQELRDRIARKEYNVKPDDIADRMIRDHMQSNGLG